MNFYETFCKTMSSLQCYLEHGLNYRNNSARSQAQNEEVPYHKNTYDFYLSK